VPNSSFVLKLTSVLNTPFFIFGNSVTPCLLIITHLR
jgi:hypothetical protein